MVRYEPPEERQPEQAKPTANFCPTSTDGEHRWEVEYLPDPMSFGSAIASGSDVCVSCGLVL